MPMLVVNYPLPGSGDNSSLLPVQLRRESSGFPRRHLTVNNTALDYNWGCENRHRSPRGQWSVQNQCLSNFNQILWNAECTGNFDSQLYFYLRFAFGTWKWAVPLPWHLWASENWHFIWMHSSSLTPSHSSNVPFCKLYPGFLQNSIK